MNRSGRAALVFAVGLAVLWLAFGQLNRPMLAADDLKPRVDKLEMDMKAVMTKLEQLIPEIRKLQTANPTTNLDKDLKELQQKVQTIDKQVQSLNGHTHDLLQEGRAPDGSVQAVRGDEFMGKGLAATGVSRISRPVMR